MNEDEQFVETQRDRENMEDEDQKAPPTELSAEDKARAEAEARRQKILSKAGNRLGLVTGETPRTEVSTTIETSNEAEAEAPSKSGKLAAMRRRRFKKGAASSKKEDLGDAGANVKDTVSEPSHGATASLGPSPGQTSNDQTTQGALKPKGDDAVEGDSTPSGDDASTDLPKKKYMGVAKMRRKMIKERQAKEEAEASENEPSSLEHKVATRKTRKISALPIAMYVTTVLLLFLAGLDIGLQQGSIDYTGPGLAVHSQLAPVRLLETLTSGRSGESSSSSKLDDQTAYDDNVDQTENEFDEEVPKTEESGGKIDPLFQVDLDQYTRGPGLLMMAGRFAVACHRVNLSIFYYFPLSIAQRMQSTATALLQSPLMLFLVALAIRHAVGKLLLGADLPEIVNDENDGKDVLAMAQNFAKSFILKSFPTMVSLYDAWAHLRSDMYVILCGLFVGIAWVHQFQIPEISALLGGAQEAAGTDKGSDEL